MIKLFTNLKITKFLISKKLGGASMRLELGKIFIKDIQFADVTEVRDGVLYVNKEEMLEAIGGDEHIKSIDIDLVRPGESVRITPVKDVIEPRVKVEGRGGIFPGIISKVDTVGEGRTHALSGCAVVTTGKIVGDISSKSLIIDENGVFEGNSKMTSSDVNSKKTLIRLFSIIETYTFIFNSNDSIN